MTIKVNSESFWWDLMRRKLVSALLLKETWFGIFVPWKVIEINEYHGGKSQINLLIGKEFLLFMYSDVKHVWLLWVLRKQTERSSKI